VKTVLFFPGYKSTEEKCRPVLGCIKKEGYNTVFGAIDWDGTTFDDWIVQARALYARYDPEDVILAGHSLGAIIAFVLATERSPHALWLLSFSGRFAEDIPRMSQESKDYLGPRVMEALGRLSFEPLVVKIRCDTLFFIGELEIKLYPELAFRVYETYRYLGAKLGSDRVRLVEAKGAKHNPADAAYLSAIASSI